MTVFIADRDLARAEASASELNAKHGQRVYAVQVDVADWNSQVKAFEFAVAKVGHIDYVFAVAGITERPWLPPNSQPTGFQKPDLAVNEVNGTGVLYAAALALQQFRRQEPNKHGFRGKMIIVGSGCSFYIVPTHPIYTYAKHAVLGFTRTMGAWLPEEKITLNCICPNIVRTNISTGQYYEQAAEEGLLVSYETVVSAFESLLGANTTSGEAIELLPGDQGFRIKERPEPTNEQVRRSLELTTERIKLATSS
ncbi:hypothetical protein BST61_g9612 [Cercospora zeina]